MWKGNKKTLHYRCRIWMLSESNATQKYLLVAWYVVGWLVCSKTSDLFYGCPIFCGTVRKDKRRVTTKLNVLKKFLALTWFRNSVENYMFSGFFSGVLLQISLIFWQSWITTDASDGRKTWSWKCHALLLKIGKINEANHIKLL